MMTPEKHKIIKGILAQVLQAPEKNQKKLLEQLCGSQPEIKIAVEKLLLLSDTKHRSLMEVPAIVSQLPNLEIQTNKEETQADIAIQKSKVAKLAQSETK